MTAYLHLDGPEDDVCWTCAHSREEHDDDGCQAICDADDGFYAMKCGCVAFKLDEAMSKEKREKMKTTPEQVVEVAKKHVTMYTHRIRLGEEVGGIRGRNINVEECKKYLAIWQSIVAKQGQNLTADEVDEVEDAYESGDYDDIFQRTN